MKQTFLTISVIIPTFNSSRTLGKSLESVKAQDYPKDLIEIIIVDGGSTDDTLRIARKFTSHIISVSKDKQNAEYNKGVGVNKAKNEILFLLDHDNILPHAQWFKKMIYPFLDSKDIIGVEPLRFYYDPHMTLLDRYFALLGGSDPVAYYFGKDSHLSWAFDTYNLYGDAVDKGEYYLVKFGPDKIPALGGNGAAVRRKILLEHALADPDNFFHIDIHVDLINKGFRTYGIFKDSIIHLTNNKVIPFLKRRKYFVEKYHFQDTGKRRYSIYEPKKDTMKLMKYILISLTLIIPIYDALRGFRKIHDVAWFIHPFMCIAMLFVYGVPTLKKEVQRFAK